MTFQNCEPIALPECELDDLLIGELETEASDTKAYEIAVAIARAAKALITSHDLMTVKDTFVTIGNPGAWPDCCNVIGVGIIEFQTESDGACWTKIDPVFELMLSACKPGGEDLRADGGPLDGCDIETLNGHALAFLRTLGLITRDLRNALCCYLPSLDCSCCGGWIIEEMTVDNTEACTEARFRIVRG